MRFVAPFLALLLAGLPAAYPAQATEQPLSSGFTAPQASFRAGMWWNPDLDGSGMDIHLSGDRLFLVWYTYETDGAPVWYLAHGPYEGGDFTAALERYTWDEASGKATGKAVGEVTLSFTGAYSAEFNWTLGEDSGNHAIEPLLVSEGISRNDHTGHWFNPDEPGYGVTFNDQGSVEFAVVYLYDQAGEPRWAFGHRTGELIKTIQLESFEGACPACEYFEPVPTAAGSVTRDFDSATQGTLTLDVDFAEPVAGQWQRQSVPIQLLSDRQDGRNHPAAMAQFASAEALEVFLKEGIRSRPPFYASPFDFSPNPPGFSRTTVQVAGVDEADTIKTDGKRLYVLGHQESVAGKSHDTVEPVLRVLRMNEEAAGVVELARLGLEGNAYERRGLYLATNRTGGKPDLLVAQRTTGGSEIYYFNGIRAPYTSGTTQISLIDVSSPATPALLSSWRIDGHLVASRRIGETLFLVTRYSADIPGFNYGAEDEELIAENERLLEETTLEDLLPDIWHNEGEPMELVSVDSTWLPPIFMERPMAELVTVSAFDLGAPDTPPATLTAIGQTEALFASTEALYLASTRYSYLIGAGGSVTSYPALMTTDIHKVGYAAEGPIYIGSASVEGHLGWDEDFKPYRFGEHKGYLGVVTSASDTWGNLGQNRLTLLQETPRTKEHRLLREVAHLPNAERPARLGKPDELLYATRFAGDRAYVLTAKRVQQRFIDPLYVVDLKNARDPRITGSLEVTGYSGFLFPLDERYMIGVGEDSVTDDNGNVISSGVKVGLYDIADPASPLQVGTEVVGWTGSRTPVTRNPRAFSYLPPDPSTGRPARLALPISETRPKFGEDPEPGTAQPWYRSGLYLFNLRLNPDRAEVLRSGEIITAHRNEGDPDWWRVQMNERYSRSVITDFNAYFVHDGAVWSAPWQQSNQQIGPQ